MSHQPPVPAGNQSPYPIQEPPHHDAPKATGATPAADATPPAVATANTTPSADKPVTKTPEPGRSDGPAIGKGALGAIAAVGVAVAAAGGAWAYTNRSKQAARKPRKGKRKQAAR